MIEAGRGCIEISRQVQAAISALLRVQADLLSDHIRFLVGAALAGDVPPAERSRLVDGSAR